jgi:transcriptional regulator with XRE-family HTH domain
VHGEVTSSKAAEARTNEAARKAISQFRRLSGLTWDQLAYLFGVSRRSIHLWMSGKPMNTSNEERLFKMLALLKELDCGNADENRELLLTPTEGEQRPIDLLAKEEFEKVREMLGAGVGRRRFVPTPLSASAWEGRLPPKPEQLVDARYESVHKELDIARVARTKRAKG